MTTFGLLSNRFNNDFGFAGSRRAVHKGEIVTSEDGVNSGNLLLVQARR
jgi:hypothetical protein